jgi:hypothetical protein
MARNRLPDELTLADFKTGDLVSARAGIRYCNNSSGLVRKDVKGNAMKLKSDYTYALVIPTSMGVRITPVNRQPVHTSSMFFMQATSAESNVGNVSASLGMRVSY